MLSAIKPVLQTDFPDCQTNPNPSLSSSLVGNIMIQRRRNEYLMNRNTALQMPLSVCMILRKRKKKRYLIHLFEKGGTVKIGKLFLWIPYKSLCPRVMFSDFNKPSEHIQSPIPSHHIRPNVKNTPMASTKCPKTS